MGTKQATKVIVTRILSDWVSLRIAIEQGLGGKDGPLKERWMAQVVSDFLNKETDLDPTDVEDYLAEILFNEFDMVVEDGTLPQIAFLLLQLQKMCQQGRIREALDQLPKERPAMPSIRAEPEPVTPDREMIVEEDMDAVSKQVASLATEELRRKTNEPDEDGWITVRKTGGKHHQTNNNNDNTNRYFTVG